MQTRNLPVSILMLAPCPFPTGQGTQVAIRHLATALARAGHRVELATYSDGDVEPHLPFIVHRSRRHGLLRAGDEQRSGPSWRKIGLDALLLHQTQQLVRRHPYHLLHAHNIEGLMLGVALKALCGLPLVYHAHNAMRPELPTYFKTRLTRLFAAFSGAVLDRGLPPFANALIVFDDAHRDYYARCGVPSRLIHVIPPGIDSQDLPAPSAATSRRVRAELGQGRFVVYAGNPDAYQNLPLLYAAMRLVRAQAADVRLLIATPHPERVFARELATTELAHCTRVYQHHHREELAALLEVAHVGACPRVLWCGAPIKVLNYLAFGLPVVACHGGSAALLHEGEGVLTAPTPEAFAAGILAMLRRGRASTRREPGLLDVQQQVPLYERVYAAVDRCIAAKCTKPQ